MGWSAVAGADLVNHSGQTRYFAFYYSVDGSTNWLFANKQTKSEGENQVDDFGDSGTYYRVAHSDSSGTVNGFWSNTIQHP